MLGASTIASSHWKHKSVGGVTFFALAAKSLYVNNAHYDAYDEEGNLLYSERWITKLNRDAVEGVE